MFKRTISWLVAAAMALGIFSVPIGAGADFVQFNISTTTTMLFVDGNRTDSYTANGTVQYPFKTISAALAYTSTYVGATGFDFELTPATYVDGAPDTWPSVPFTVHGNNATYVPASGATMPASFDIYDLSIIGNVTESDTSTTVIHQFNNGFIQGAVNLGGLATFLEMSTGTTSVITALPGSLVNIEGSDVNEPIVDYGGIMNLNDNFITMTSNTNYAITATTTGSQLTLVGANIFNFGTGGGINISDGATSSPNALIDFALTVNTSTPAGALHITGAKTQLCGYTLTNLAGTTIQSDGTSFTPCTNGDTGTSVIGISSSTPAALGGAETGHFVIPAGGTTANASTTDVSANSSIIVQQELTTPIAGTTCNQTVASDTVISTKVAGNGFTVLNSYAPVSNPQCEEFWVIN